MSSSSNTFSTSALLTISQTLLRKDLELMTYQNFHASAGEAAWEVRDPFSVFFAVVYPVEDCFYGATSNSRKVATRQTLKRRSGLVRHFPHKIHRCTRWWRRCRWWWWWWWLSNVTEWEKFSTRNRLVPMSGEMFQYKEKQGRGKRWVMLVVGTSSVRGECNWLNYVIHAEGIGTCRPSCLLVWLSLLTSLSIFCVIVGNN